MKFFVKFIEKYAEYILIAVFLVTLAMIPGIKRITIARGFDNDALPAFNDLVKSVKEVRKTFATDMRQVIISVEAQKDRRVTDGHSLELLKSLTVALKGVSVVKRESVMSLMTVKQVLNTPDGIASEKLVNKIPSGTAETAALEDRIAHDAFYYGRLISKDFRTSLIIATAYDSADLAEIHKQVAKVVEPFRDRVPGLVITLVGDPEINYELNSSIEKDIVVFVLLAVLLILVSFLAIFRSWNGVVLPLCGIVTGIIWTMGLMGYYGEPILIISATLPVVLVVIGSEYCIHVYHTLHEQTAAGHTFRLALSKAVSSVFSPLFMATMATFTGGMSLVTFKIRPIQHFGIFMGIGTVILMFVALVLIPALFKVLSKPAKKFESKVVGGIRTAHHLATFTLYHVPVAGPITGALVRTVGASIKGGLKGGLHGAMKGADLETLMDRFLRATAKFVARFSLPIVLLVPVILAVAMANAKHIEIGFDNVSMLPKGSVVRDVTQRLDKAFGGTQQFDVMLDSNHPGGAIDPLFLEKVALFEEDARTLSDVSHTFSIVHIIKKVHALIDPKSKHALPEGSDAIAQYLLLLSMSDSGVPMTTMLTSDNQKLRVNITVGVHDTQTADLIYQKLEGFAQDRFGDSARLRIGGDLVHSIAITRYLVWGKLQNVLIAILAIFLLIVVSQRSIVRGFLTILTLPVGCMMNFGLMGYAGIRLDFATAIITSVAMGMGVDYAIHFIAGVKEMYRKNKDINSAIEKAIVSTGRVMIYSGMCTMVGFSVLFFSNFRSIHIFATLMCFTMASLLVLSLLVLPALMRLVPPEFITNHRKLHHLDERKVSFAMKVAFSSLIVAILSYGIIWVDAKAATEPSVDEILKKAVQNVYAKAEESTYVMKLIDADGKENARKMKVWFKREGEEKAKLLIKFSEPADIRGTGLLNIIEKGKQGDQWLYLPAIKKVRRIKGGNEDEAFLGSDFTTGDLSVDTKDRFTYTVAGSKKYEGADCYELVGVPAGDVDKTSLPYSKKIMLVRKDNSMAMRTEFYNQGNELEKVLTLSGVHQESDKKWMADRMEMKNLLSKHVTLIQIEKRDRARTPADSIFTQSNLEKN